jgi:hypothetical protein
MLRVLVLVQVQVQVQVLVFIGARALCVFIATDATTGHDQGPLPHSENAHG